MPDTTAFTPLPDGPWWVLDKETGHRFVTFSPGDHLEVLSESPYTASGALRTAEPAKEVSASKKGASK